MNIPFWAFLAIVFVASSIQASRVLSTKLLDYHESRIQSWIESRPGYYLLPLSKTLVYYILGTMITIGKIFWVNAMIQEYYYFIPFAEVLALLCILLSHRWPFIDRGRVAPRSLLSVVAAYLFLISPIALLSFGLAAILLGLLLFTHSVVVPISLALVLLGMTALGLPIDIILSLCAITWFCYAAELFAFFNRQHATLLDISHRPKKH